MEKALLTTEEMALGQHCVEYALAQGASAVRVTLTKSLMNLIGLLNGEVDKTSHALDRSLQLQFFADGRFGAFSTNRLEQDGVEAFIREALQTVRMLEPDACRALPAPERLVQDARNGQELGLYDAAVEGLTAPERRTMALHSMAWPHKAELEQGFRLISEEENIKRINAELEN